MLSSVYFDDQFFLQADEINNVWSDGSLSAEFVSSELAEPEMVP